MKVQDAMTVDVRTCPPEANVAQVAQVIEGECLRLRADR